jgi:4'-phosphopantetheinyl transferase
MSSTDFPEWDQLLVAAHAWHLSTDNLSADLFPQWPLRWLTATEIAELDRLASDRLRCTRLAARTLSRVVLSRYTGVDPAAWRFVAAAHGKPAIVGPAVFESLRFNLAHTDGLVVCAVSRAGEVGVDAEETSRIVNFDQVSRHFFSAAEQARLAALPLEQRAEGFFEQWVLKEAYVKGQGTGLSQSLEGFTIARSENGQPLAIGNWQFALNRPTPRHVAAVALHRRHAGESVIVEWRAAERLMASRESAS